MMHGKEVLFLGIYPIYAKEYNWNIFEDPTIGPVIAILLAIPFLIIDFKGVKAVGTETFKPSKEQELVETGIYKYIRHPQTIGEMPLFLLGAIFLNSWFLVIWATIFLILYIPTIIYWEEKDLVRRFGKNYEEYRERVGAIFPKIRKKKMKDVTN